MYSDKSLIYSLSKYDNFVELASNTNFDFDYVDKLPPHIAEKYIIHKNQIWIETSEPKSKRIDMKLRTM